MSYTYPFRMCSATATMLAIDPETKEIIIGVRSDTARMFPNCDSLPGGFMEAKWEVGFLATFKEWVAFILRKMADKLSNYPEHDNQESHPGETLEETAIRELREELSIIAAKEQLHLFDVRSNPRTDSRAHVVNACFWFELTPMQSLALKAGDDLKDVKRIKIKDILDGNYKEHLAFNHSEILMKGLKNYQEHKEFLRFKELKLEGVA